jgi:putative transposase
MALPFKVVIYYSIVNRTIKIRLPNDIALIDTCSEYSKVANQIVGVGWDITDNRFELHHIVYGSIKKTSKLNSNLAISCIGKVCSSIKASKNKPHFKSCLGVVYTARSYWVKLSEGICSLSTLQGRKKYGFVLPDYYKKYLSWKVCGSELVYDSKKRLWLHVVVSKEVVSNTCSTSAVHNLGIDLGVNNLAVTSDNKFYKGVSRKLGCIERLRGDLQHKGTKSAKRHLKKLSGGRKRFVCDVNHRIAKEIVCSLPSGSTIVMENLRGIGEQRKGKVLNRILSKWSFFEFRDFLTYKAEERDISVVLVDPKNTSKCCSVCGQIGTRNKGFFKCACGYSINSDLNGARNILARLNPCGNESRVAVNRPIVAPLIV